MAAPERLRIEMGAADGLWRFEKLGIVARIGSQLDPSSVQRMLAAQIGRVFVLSGRRTDTDEEVLLKINNAHSDTLTVSNYLEPPFVDAYRVTQPRVSEPHGDYQFTLERVDET